MYVFLRIPQKLCCYFLLVLGFVIDCSETNDVNTGLLIEVWSKGMIWDRALGYHYIPLRAIQYSNEVSM